MNDSLQFSIVITTRNRPRQLQNLLSGVAALDFARNRFEVIVVDDGGTEPLEPVVSRFTEQLQLQFIHQEPGGPASGRNTGVAAARGRYLAFIDDDCVPNIDWLSRLENALELNPGAMVGGRTVNGLPANAYSAASQFTLDMVYAFYNENPRSGRFFATNNMAVAREQFLALGGFDADFVLSAAEDRDLCDRWKHAGFSMVYEPAAVIGHFHDLTLASFCRQQFVYGRGAVRFHAKALERGSGRMRDHFGFHRHLPTWFVRAWRGQRPASPVRVALLFLTGQTLHAAGFFYEHLRRT